MTVFWDLWRLDSIAINGIFVEIEDLVLRRGVKL